MYKNFDPSKPYFYGVAMVLIICGAGAVAVGLVEWLSNIYGSTLYFAPSLKVMGGLIILALGYVHLELELIRIKK